MSDTLSDVEALRHELTDLRQRLEVAEAIVRAIDQSEVDAFVVRPGGAEESEVLVLGNADRPYRLLIERMQQGAATLARDGTILYSNRRLAEMAGSERPGLSGCSLFDLVAVRDRAAVQAAVTRGSREPTETAVTLAPEGADELRVQLTVSPLLDGSGLACAVVSDLSSQREIERQRERLLQEEAARAVADHTARVLREADQRKDVFLATLGHELRNPLGALGNGLHVLRLKQSGEAVVQRTHEILARQLDTLVRLVDDLLDLSRLTQGKISLQRSRFDLRQVVGRALDTCQAQIAERRHHLETTLADQPVLVEADEVRVTQVLTNLLNNAAKYTPEGGRIALRVEASPARGDAVLRVSDTGIGIAADVLGRIFEPFAQVDTGTPRATGGLGIGLTLSRSLVEMHGGTLTASSQGPGHGSEFVVRLPLAKAQREPTTLRGPLTGRPEPRAARIPTRILVVDDNCDAAESLGLLLRHLGHEVRLEHCSLQVHESVLAFQPAVVLLDIGLPDIDGYEVARRLRSDPRCRGVLIIALSGYASDADRRRSLAAGFDGHCAKPIDVRELDRLLSLAAPAPRDPQSDDAASAAAD
ncbi:MAG TPA: ATP-binding protein [Planctomycetota bacterium]|nr:ATP-binding protein [Planctomycetota bacterium]